MAGDTFNTYYGEFALSPVPVELSFNYCSHACGYCFANLNKPDRKAGIQSTLNLIRDRYKRESLEAYFLREQYPVLISNRVDPFAASNYRQAIPIMRLLAEMDIPIAFQTKGGKGIDEVLEFIKPSCWYISIATLDDEHRQRMEPGAPSIKERFELVEKLVAAGHWVSVGINPAVPEWLPERDIDALSAEVFNRGAYGVWIERLHFNRKQLAVMPERMRSQFSEEMIKRSTRRISSDDYVEYFAKVEASAEAAGLEIFCGEHPRPSLYWTPYRKCYEKLLPTNQEFINYLVEAGTPDNSLLYLDQYLDFMLPQMPEGKLRLGHYIGATSHQVCREDPNWSNWMSYEQLLTYLWSDGRIKMSLLRNWAFSYACDRDTKGKLVERFDQFGHPILIFSTQGFRSYQVEV